MYRYSISLQDMPVLARETEKMDRIKEERDAREKRSLKGKYTAIFADALVTKIRRDTVKSDAATN